MDTLSRDSSSSSNNILPYAAIAIGVIGLLVGGITFVKAKKLEGTLAEQGVKLQEIDAVRGEVQTLSTKVDGDVKTLREGVQSVLAQVGSEIGALKGQVAKLEEAAKKPAPVAGPKGAKGAPATGTVDANGNYTVGPGDTIAKIAKKFGTKADSIEAENPGLNPAKLRVGQKIKIPKK